MECMKGSPWRRNTVKRWKPPQIGCFIFNVDGAIKETPDPAGIEGLPHNHLGNMLALFY